MRLGIVIAIAGVLGAVFVWAATEERSEIVPQTAPDHHAAASSADSSAAGTELIGQPAPGWNIQDWRNSPPLELAELRGKVVLVRWWTDTCPFCRRSAPALNEFHEKYQARGLVVIGMYHPKPLHRSATLDAIQAAADQRGFRFPIAVDRDWSELRRWWLEGRRRAATSVSFLIDKRGVIRHVHPGPVFHREVLHGNEGPRADFLKLQQVIEMLLAEASEV